MNALLKPEFKTSQWQFLPDTSGSTFSLGEDMAGNTRTGAEFARLESDSGDTATAESPAVHNHNSRQRLSSEGSHWLNTRFDRPCTTASPLNDI